MCKGAFTAYCKLLTLYVYVYVYGRTFKMLQKFVAIVCVLIGFERGYSGIGYKSTAV